MSSFDEWTDDELMAELGKAVAERDAVSERRRAAAKAAFTWRAVEEELAELLHDSALEAGAAVRSVVDAPRMLSFGLSGVILELEVSDGEVLGQVIAEGAATAYGVHATVILRRPDTPDRRVEADGAGFFRIDDVGPGPARFLVDQAGWTLTTPWVTL